MRKKLWQLIGASNGGPNRAKILMELEKKPRNAHQISEILGLNYKTVRHHLKILFENDLVTTIKKNSYGELYFLSKGMSEHFELFKDIVLTAKKN